MKRKIRILNIIAIVCLAIQLLSYLGSLAGKHEAIDDTAELLGYYVGLNFFLLISVVLFTISSSLKNKMKKRTQHEMIDSIGKPE